MGIQIICGDPLFAKDEEEIRSLLNQGKALKKQVLRKEKNMYAKAMKSVSKDKTGTEKVVQWQDEDKSRVDYKKVEGQRGGGRKVKNVENGKNSSNEDDDVIWEDIASRKGDCDDDEEEDDDVYWTVGAVLAVAAVIGIGLFAWGRSKRRV